MLCSTPDHVCSTPEQDFALQSLLTKELAEVKRQLDQLSFGQAALASSMERISSNLESLFTDDADRAIAEDNSCKPPTFTNPSIGNINGGSAGNAVTEILNQAHDRRRAAATKELTKIVEVKDEVARVETKVNHKRAVAAFLARAWSIDRTTLEHTWECVTAGIILSNAIFVGLSADNWRGEVGVYMYLDSMFSIIFFWELVLRVRIIGCRQFLCGEGNLPNLLDVMLVSLDTFQLFLVMFEEEDDDTQATKHPPASLFRIVRLMRILRVLRLLRFDSSKDLLLMIEGITCGMWTLACAMVVFFLIIYMGALVCKTFFGRDEYPDTYPYFSSVPRSMYTVFRCSFGDCSTKHGTPISEFLQVNFGSGYSVLYCIYIFSLEIGLFNVISSIFVDSTMGRAAENSRKLLQDRFADQQLWATSVRAVIKRCLEKRGFQAELNASGGEITQDMLKVTIPAAELYDLCQHDDETLAALDNLDIDPHDHVKLAQILDPHHTGSIDFVDMVHGLQQLRGQPRRSDIVTINLMLHAAQEMQNEIYHAVLESTNLLSKSLEDFVKAMQASHPRPLLRPFIHAEV